VLASGQCSGNGVSLVLIRPRWHAIQAKGCQSLPAPGCSRSRASPAVPASPCGGREDLDNVSTAAGQRAEEIKALEDPRVVGARSDMLDVGCPADAADLPGELEFAFTRCLACGRAGTRAVDRHDCRLHCQGEVSDLLVPQRVLQRQYPAVIDDGGIEALPLAAYSTPIHRATSHSMPARA
jgi:hypothetical protein